MTEQDNVEHVLYRVEDGIARITLNRPKQRNALSVQAFNRLHALWSEIDNDPQVRVVILDSADCGTFCAGMDLKEAAQIKQTSGADILTLLEDPFFERMRQVKKPIIAAMTGHFTAGGIMLALNSDLRVGLAGTQGGITEAKRGRGSPWAVPLVWMLPLAITMEMVLTAELISIERLRELGFINYVEETPEQVRLRAHKVASSIRDNAPLSVSAGKASLMRAMDLGCEKGLQAAKQIHEAVYSSKDAQEGPLAFAEKRKPVWTGT